MRIHNRKFSFGRISKALIELTKGGKTFSELRKEHCPEVPISVARKRFKKLSGYYPVEFSALREPIWWFRKHGKKEKINAKILSTMLEKKGRDKVASILGIPGYSLERMIEGYGLEHVTLKIKTQKKCAQCKSTFLLATRLIRFFNKINPDRNWFCCKGCYYKHATKHK